MFLGFTPHWVKALRPNPEDLGAVAYRSNLSMIAQEVAI
jgi:hypothetical protein